MRKILIINDDPEIILLFERILKKNGYASFHLRNGNEALRLLENETFDLVLMDIQIPGIDGFETTRQIRQKFHAIDLPILFISAIYKDMATRFKVLEYGGNDYLSVPFDEAELIFKVKSLLAIRDLSEDLKNVKDEFFQSEQKWKYIFDNSGIGMLVESGATLRTEFMNRAFAEMHGFEEEELRGKYFKELQTGEQESSLANCRQQAKETGFSSFESRQLRKNGEEFDALINICFVKSKDHKSSYNVIYIQDISKLKESEFLIKNILENIEEGILVVDREFTILSINNAFYKLSGYPDKNIIGKKCYQIMYSSDIPCIEKGLACPAQITLNTGKPSTVIQKFNNRKGINLILEKKSYLMRGVSGGGIKIIETLRDITENVKLEEKLRYAQKMDAIGQLTGGIAHDFNNILNALIGFADLMQVKIPRENFLQTYITEILTAAERGAKLTKDLLSFSRKQPLNLEPFLFSEIILGLETLFKRLFIDKIELKINYRAEEIMAYGDRSLLGQVLLNLAINARDAMPDGGEIHIEVGDFFMDNDFIKEHGFGESGAYTEIIFSDNGIGMDPEILDRIFEPFFTTKEASKGAGLGLSVVYGIIKQHEGYIRVQSQKGQGAAFYLYLPKKIEN
jgi:PAS domain S-box-containing protein